MIPLFAVLGVLAMIGLGYLVMVLWNHLIPLLFHGPVITFWQAVGLFILARILLHTFGHGHHPGHYWNRGRYYHWKARMEERMASMSPEEREKFREEWSTRCRPGYWHHKYWQTEPQSPKTE